MDNLAKLLYNKVKFNIIPIIFNNTIERDWMSSSKQMWMEWEFQAHLTLNYCIRTKYCYYLPAENTFITEAELINFDERLLRRTSL